jgi:beta-glucanase (GH16 family)
MSGLRFFYKFLSIIVIALLFTNCSGSSDGDGGDNPNLPSNLVVNTEIVGADASNPNGNGSGIVNFTVSADNATSYKILIGSDVINTTTGLVSYTFTQSGTNSYTIYVSAYNGSQFISTTKVIIVYVTMTMAWGDEFNDGQLDSSKWTYETGAGGWGNNELQYYTNRPENLVVQNGMLKIKLIKELYNGSNYTSARIVTKNKYQFQYGRVDIRAKIPAGGGTWPALWMLGSDINSSPWPACGEIDIMEHVGNNPNRIFSTLHHPGHSGGNGDSGNVLISNATTEFHIYSCEWSASAIKFYVDNVLFYTFSNNSSLPFNKPFFFIFNCAMGGNFGGAVDPNFTSATFEIDYVHVYH